MNRGQWGPWQLWVHNNGLSILEESPLPLSDKLTFRFHLQPANFKIDRSVSQLLKAEERPVSLRGLQPPVQKDTSVS